MRLRGAHLLGGAVALGLAGTGAAWWLTRAPDTPEDQVRAVVNQVAEGAEEADLGAVLGAVSERYADEQGATRDTIRGVLFRQFQARGPLHVALGPIAVELADADHATARFQAVLVERTAGTPWPEDADALYFEVAFERQEGTWLVVSHTRRPATEGPPPGL